MDDLPAEVRDFVRCLRQLGPFPPKVIKWRRDGEQYVAVLEDGRQLFVPTTTVGAQHTVPAVSKKGKAK